jgi:hypothetical protein
MSIVDKVKEMLGQHSNKAEQGIDKTGDRIDEKTGGKHGEQVDQGQERAKDYLRQDAPKDDRPGA